jgi:hypothetical protein
MNTDDFIIGQAGHSWRIVLPTQHQLRTTLAIRHNDAQKKFSPTFNRKMQTESFIICEAPRGFHR